MTQEFLVDYSDVIQGHVVSSDLGFNFKNGTVTWAAGMQLGTALKFVAGKYVAAAAADDADIVAVLTDPRTLPAALKANPIAAGDVKLSVGTRGLTVNGNYFNYANGNPVSAAGITAFELVAYSKVTTNTVGNQPR